MSVENKLPEGWVDTKLEDSVDILDSMRVPVNNKERHVRVTGKPESELYPYFGATGEVGKIDGYLFDEELVALGEDGVPFLDPLKPKAYMLHGKTWVNNHAHVLRAVNGLAINKFVFYFLNQFDYQGFVNGGTRLKLTQANMRKMPLPLPPLAEQQVIADQLDTLLAQVEATKTRLERIPDVLKRFRQSVLAAAVSGKLTEGWRESLILEPVQLETIDVEDREGIFSTLSPNQIPSNWRLHRLKEVGNFLGGGTPAKSEKDYWNGNIPWVTPKDMKIPEIKKAQLNISTKGLNNSSTKLIKSESILFVVRGMILAHSFPTAISKAELTINQDMKAIECFSMVNPSYLKYALDSQKGAIVGMAGSSTHGTKRLEAKHINNIPVPLPPLPEQQEIVRRVEQLFAYADTIERQVEAAQQRVNQLTQSILAKAFRGELTADWRAANPELISGDNSAEALLARIKEERAAQQPKKRARAAGSGKTGGRKKKTA